MGTEQVRTSYRSDGCGISYCNTYNRESYSMRFVASHILFGTCWLLKLDSQKVKAYVIIPLYTNNRFTNIRLYEMQNLRDTVPVYKLRPLANLSSTFFAGSSDTDVQVEVQSFGASIPDDHQPTHAEEFTFQYVTNICVALIFVIRMIMFMYFSSTFYYVIIV